MYDATTRKTIIECAIRDYKSALKSGDANRIAHERSNAENAYLAVTQFNGKGAEELRKLLKDTEYVQNLTDMFYGDAPESADRVTVSFSLSDCMYRGNILEGGKIIGKYTLNSWEKLQKTFPQFTFRCDF